MTAQIPVSQIQTFRDSTPAVMALRLQEQEVTAYWGVIFSPKGIATLTKQDMTGFLSYRQNHRWREISREDVTADMERLRVALACLIDEARPVAERLNALEPGRGELAVAHLGKAKLTPILLVTGPRSYGVWNDYAERALAGMGLMPEFAQGERLGDRYAQVNAVLLELAATYRVSLWWLDVILERIARLVR
ncbi:MAG TPA: hypothetical protein VMT30_07855 [Candidatus Saccharimonadia bacterium]|nr:hypothetical protein [Candidatus Saccharimonadia bacterium]